MVKALSLFSFQNDFRFFQLEMKNQYIKANGNRSMNSNTFFNNQINQKNHLASRLKVIEFLKDQLYPTGKICFEEIFVFFANFNMN